MKWLDKMRRVRIAEKNLEVTPDLIAMAIVTSAMGDVNTYFKQIEKYRDLDQSIALTDKMSAQVSAEFLLAVYCLFSLRAQSAFNDRLLSDLFMQAVSVKMRNLNDDEEPDSFALVRAVFADVPFCQGTLDAYLNHRFEPAIEVNLEHCKALFQVTEDNPLHFFSGVMHSRLMSHLLVKNDFVFTGMFLSTAAQVNSLWQLFSKWKPVFESAASV